MATERRARRWLLAGIVVAAVAGVHAAFAAGMRVPIIFGDELGYVENARYLVHGGARPAFTYYPGLSVLLAPVWWFTSQAIVVWRAAQVLNTVAAVVVLLECVALGSLCGLSRRDRWLVAVVAAAYPAVLLYSDVALAELGFQAVFGALVLLVVAATRRRHRAEPVGLWGLIGLVTGALCIVHPRGFAVFVAVVLFAVLTADPLRAHLRSLLALAAGLVGGIDVLRILTTATRAENVGGRLDYQAGAVALRGLSVHALPGLAVGLVGRVFYLSLATVGLAPLAVGVGVVALLRVRRRREPGEIAAAFVALAGVGVVALSVLFFTGTNRLDQVIHGRYVDGVVAPMLVVAMARLLDRSRRAWATWVATAVPALVLTGLVLAAYAASRHLVTDLNGVAVIGLDAIESVMPGHTEFVALAAIGVGAIVALSAMAWWRPGVAIATVFALFAVSSVSSQFRYLQPGSRSKATQTVVANAVRNATRTLGVQASCVTYDGPIDPAFFIDRFELGRQPLEVLPATGRACGDFVISTRPDVPSRFPGARQVIDENDVVDDLYVLAGPTQDRLASAGWLLPSTTPGPLPAGQRAVLTLRPARSSIVLRAGTAERLGVTVENAGAASPWPAQRGIKQGDFAVRVAARWYPQPGRAPAVLSNATELPRSLLPGESVPVPVVIDSRLRHGGALPPGAYTVQLVVYQEGTGDFAGAITVDVQLTP